MSLIEFAGPTHIETAANAALIKLDIAEQCCGLNADIGCRPWDIPK